MSKKGKVGQAGFVYIGGEIKTVLVEMENKDSYCVSYQVEGYEGLFHVEGTKCVVIDKSDFYDTYEECQKSRLVPDVIDLKQSDKWIIKQLHDTNETLNKIKNNWLMKLICKL